LSDKQTTRQITRSAQKPQEPGEYGLNSPFHTALARSLQT
jgi:hypothetical protein